MKQIKLEKTFNIIPNFEEYACSIDGEIIKVKTGKTLSKFLVGIPAYYSVNFTIGGKSKQQRLHRLIAMAWIPNDDPVNKIQVNHKDGDKFNNSIENLEWVTPSQNQQHAIVSGLKGKGEELYNSLLLDDQVHEICKLLVEGWTTKELSEKYSVPRGIILQLRSGDAYVHIRSLYDIPVKSRESFSESTIRWICENIVKGFPDLFIAKNSSSKKVTIGLIKKIRYKIRYQSISNEYF